VDGPGKDEMLLVPQEAQRLYRSQRRGGTVAFWLPFLLIFVSLHPLWSYWSQSSTFTSDGTFHCQTFSQSSDPESTNNLFLDHPHCGTPS
jgi:hypothetical protein